MRYIFLISLILSLCLGQVAYAQEQRPELELISVDNAQWLIPLDNIGLGRIESSAWMPDNRHVAILREHGVSIYDTLAQNGSLTIIEESEIRFPRIDQLLSSSDFKVLYGIEVIEDLRPEEAARINVWDLSTGNLVSSIAGIERLDSLSPDGQLAVYLTGANIVELYSISTGRRVSVIATIADAQGANFSPDGRYLVIDGANYFMDSSDTPFMSIYDLSTEAIIASSDMEAFGLPYFSPDGRYISNSDGTELWEFDASTNSLNYLGEDLSAYGIQNLEQIVYAGGIRRIYKRLILADGTPWQIDEHYSNNGYLVSTGSGAVIGYMAIDGNESILFTIPAVSGLAYSPDSSTLYYSSYQAARIDNRSTMLGLQLEPRAYPFGRPNYGFYADEGNIFVEFYYHDNILHVYDLRLEDSILRVDFGRRSSIAVSENRQWVAWSEEEEAETYLLNLQTGNRYSFPKMYDLGLSPDGRFLAGFFELHLRVFNVATGEVVLEADHIPTEARSYDYLMAFSPDNRFFALYQTNESIRIFDMQSGELHHTIVLNPNPLRIFGNALTFSSDGDRLLLASTDKHFLWNVAELGETETAYDYILRYFESNDAFSRYNSPEIANPEAIHLTYQNGTLHMIDANGLWEEFFIPPWRNITVPSNPNYDYETAPLSPDGTLRFGATTSYFFASKIYDAETGDLLNWLRLSEESNPSMQSSPDGYTVATGQGSLTIWGVPVSPSDPNSVLCEGAPPSLLTLGEEAIVTATTGPRNLRVRTYPNGIVSDSIPSGEIIRIERGPVCDGSARWWGISNADGSIQGWSAEALDASDYLLLPLE